MVMNNAKIVRIIGVAILTLVVLVGAGKPALADFGPFDLPAGFACNFALRYETRGEPQDEDYKEFVDKMGNTVLFYAGKGATVILTNIENGKTLTIDTHGYVDHRTVNADGSYESITKGHHVLIFFPSDLPEGIGPSTTLYVGRLVYTVDVDSTFTLKEFSGRMTDLCAALD
jgi:hypothetical protein